MKRKTSKRTIKPKPDSNANARDGIVSITRRRPETAKELDDILEAATPNPERDLRAIVKDLSAIVEDADALLADVKRGESGAVRIEDASPEYFAVNAKSHALNALSHIKNADTVLAVKYSILATQNYWFMVFTDEWEPMVARARDQAPTPPTDKRKLWAVEFADHLLSQGFSKFPDAWESIGDGEDTLRFDDYEVYRDGDSLKATSHKKGDDSITKSTFRTKYFSPQKNNI